MNPTDHLSQTARKLIAVLIVIIILALIVILGGCSKTTYLYKRCVDNVCIEASAETRRKFKSFHFKFNPETGLLELIANEVSTDYSPLEYAAADFLKKLNPTALIPQVPE